MGAVGINGGGRYILRTGGGHITTKGCGSSAVHRQARQSVGGTHRRLQVDVAGASGQIQCPGVARVTVDGTGDRDVAHARAGGQRRGRCQNHITGQQNIAVGSGMRAVGVDRGGSYILRTRGGDIASKGCGGSAIHSQAGKCRAVTHIGAQLNVASARIQVEILGAIHCARDDDVTAVDGGAKNGRPGQRYVTGQQQIIVGGVMGGSHVNQVCGDVLNASSKHRHIKGGRAGVIDG